MEKNQLINNINNIESELKSYEEEKEYSYDILNSNKKSIINEVKSGSFDEMLEEIEARERKKKKETLIDKIFKLF
jgi:hypothetical protein